VTISVEGGRVLGCLVEKQFTTPQQYPLTLNALSSACNQSTNRQPVMTLDDRTVEQALDELKALGLVRFVLPSHGKSVTRYRHVFDETYGLDAQRSALLAVLLLRGPQTAGELRARAERMAELDSVAAVNHELEMLASYAEPLVQLLARLPGQKEDRWQQLVAAEAGAGSSGGTDSVVAEAPNAESRPSFPVEPENRGASVAQAGPTDRTDLTQRIDSLEAQLNTLHREVAVLSDSLVRLRRGLGDDVDSDEKAVPLPRQ
jgi:uncharacterized protein YceH (UPF0502 family)